MIGLAEFILIFFVIGYIWLLTGSVRRLVKSKLTFSQKALWVIIIIFTQLIGMIAFVLFHDYMLNPALRAGRRRSN